ncbi:hypothetical protein K7432_005982 [Basidiobolus ranarum]|uniref:Uncharacterized protein n=1 Tax=Basidiobolus ranarum TaxID=34480 RepID=A0ABR2W2B0_9FUNG
MDIEAGRNVQPGLSSSTDEDITLDDDKPEPLGELVELVKVEQLLRANYSRSASSS